VGAAFFFFYSISSEYQIERINPPKFFEGIKVEALWNEGQHFSTVGEKLDNFSTIGRNQRSALRAGFRDGCG